MTSIDEQLKALQLEKAKLELEQLKARRALEEKLLGTPVRAAKAATSAIAWPFLFVLRHIKTILIWAFLLAIIATALVALFLWRENEQKLVREAVAREVEIEISATCGKETAAWLQTSSEGMVYECQVLRSSACQRVVQAWSDCREKARTTVYERKGMVP